MKKYFLIWVLVAFGYTANAQYAEPAVSGANFIPNTTTVGSESDLKISFANSGSTSIPLNAIELTISTPSTYYKTDGTTLPTGAGAALFTWTYLGNDIWRGTNKVVIPAFAGGDIMLMVKGILASTTFETTNINVQPVSNFSAFADSPSNNNLQPKLKVNNSAQVCLLPKAYLQGALFGVLLPDTLMRDDLRTKGFIPTTSPYVAMGMTGLTNANTTTLAVVGPTSPSGVNAIVDWVFVELRSGSDSTLVVDSRAALIQRDGDIVDVDGISAVKFSQAAAGNYYVVVRHRNHLGVMSVKTPLSGTCTTIDFRKASTPTFNLDATNPVNQSQVVVEQGRALWAGNALYVNTSDGKHNVIFQGTDNDVNVIYQQVINANSNLLITPYYKLKGYYAGDINMNGEVIFQGTTNDVEFIYQNVIKNHSGNTLVQPFFKIREQIP